MSRNKENNSLPRSDFNKVLTLIQDVLKTGSCCDAVEISEATMVKITSVDNKSVDKIDVDISAGQALPTGKTFLGLVGYKNLRLRARNGLCLNVEIGRNIDASRKDISKALSKDVPIGTTRSSFPPRPTRSSVPPKTTTSSVPPISM